MTYLAIGHFIWSLTGRFFAERSLIVLLSQAS